MDIIFKHTADHQKLSEEFSRAIRMSTLIKKDNYKRIKIMWPVEWHTYFKHHEGWSLKWTEILIKVQRRCLVKKRKLKPRR